MFTMLDCDSDDSDDYVDGIFQGSLHSWDNPTHGHRIMSYVKSRSRVISRIGGPNVFRDCSHSDHDHIDNPITS